MNQVLAWMEQLPGISEEVLAERESIQALINEAIQLGNQQAVLFTQLMELRTQSEDKRSQARAQAEELESRLRQSWPQEVIEHAKNS